MRALVISGGGSKGAWAGGYASRLIEKSPWKYDMFLGTSTGSLLAPLLAAGELDRIREAFTNVGQSDIFSSCPFVHRRMKDGSLNIGMHHFNILKMFLRRKKTFGESLNLLKVIQNTLSPDIFATLQKSKTEVIVTVSNLSKDIVEFKRLKDETYEDYCKWMWAGANVVPFMSLYEHDGMNYADGGYGCYAPIKEAIKRGAREVDVIILRPANVKKEREVIHNVFSLWFSTVDFMHQRRAEDDIELGKNEAIKRHARLRIHYLPEKLTENSLIFDPMSMKKWWQDAYKYADHSEPYDIDWTYHR